MSCVLFPRFIGPVPIDVVIDEEHHAELAITRNPIEFGADVADHAYVEPKRLRMRGIVGSNPFAGGVVHGFPTTRVQAAYEALVRVQETKEPFDIVTGLTIYTNMLIEHIRAIRDVKSSGVLDFDVYLREVIIVGSASAPGSQGRQQGKSPRGRADAAGPRPEPGATAQRAAGEINRGQVSPAPQPTSPATVEGARNVSMLHQMLGL